MRQIALGFRIITTRSGLGSCATHSLLKEHISSIPNFLIGQKITHRNRRVGFVQTKQKQQPWNQKFWLARQLVIEFDVYKLVQACDKSTPSTVEFPDNPGWNSATCSTHTTPRRDTVPDVVDSRKVSLSCSLHTIPCKGGNPEDQNRAAF